MNIYPKVVGLIQASNEWPLLAISISHVLLNHVDVVYLLKHNCTDGSDEGINRLQSLWKDRLRVLEFHDDQFLQEASMSALIEISQESSPDWVYVFDADEFLLTSEDKSLKQIISDIGPGCSVIRYEIQNWISLNDFDDTILHLYRNLHYRSVPNVFINMNSDLCVDEIMAGNMTFYDLPFPSKVIFRNNAESWLSAGSHALKNPSWAQEFQFRPDEISAAHFPFLTKARLLGKAKQGEFYIKAGFPAGHGWQDQMIYRLLRENRLDEFWDRHSIGKQTGGDGGIFPSFKIDDRFPRAIDQTLSFLGNSLGSDIMQRTVYDGSAGQSPTETQISFRTMVQVTRKFQLIADSIRCGPEPALNQKSWNVWNIFIRIFRILLPPNSSRNKFFHLLIRPFQKRFQN
jgi:hypothetical protein